MAGSRVEGLSESDGIKKEPARKRIERDREGNGKLMSEFRLLVCSQVN